MKTTNTRSWSWLLCAAVAVVPAVGLAANVKAKPKPGPVGECTAKHGVKTEKKRERCVLAVYARQCRVDEGGLYDAIARALDVKPREVWMTMGRAVHESLERGGPCARNSAERHQLAEMAMEDDDAEREAEREKEERQKTESPKDWLLDQLGGPNREIDSLAIARAFEERAALLSGAKRAGLPVPAIPGWTNLTGFTQSEGRVNHILFPSVASSTNIIAGADGGGIWRSTNTGTSWTPNNDFFGSLSIANLAKALNDDLTIYAATNPRGSHTFFPFGIAKSTDGGVNWTQIATTSPGANADFQYVTRVAVHPTNSSMVLAATGAGAYLSTTGGTSWTKVGGISTDARFVAFHPLDGNRMAIGYNDGTVRYTTTGDILGAGASTSTVLSGARYTKIAYAKSDVTRMYALVSDGTTGNTRLYMSTTSGASWTEVTSLPAVGPGMYHQNYLSYTGGLWVDPLNANRLGLFEGWAFFTADVTQPTPTWKSLASGWTDMHSMVEDPAYDGVTNKTVYVMDDGGLYRTTDIDNLDQFASFARLDTGMTVTQVYSVAGRGGNPVLGAQDVGPRVWKTDPSVGDSTNKWRFIGRTTGGSWIGDGMTVAASTSNPNVLYGSRQYLDMIRSTDGGATAVSIVKNSALIDGQGATVPNTNASFLAPFVLDPSNSSRMYAGGLSIWRSNDVDTGNPPTWTAIRGHYLDAACGMDMPAGVIAVAPSNPDIVWVGYSCTGHVFKSTNATQVSPTFTEVTTMPVTTNNWYKSSITIDRYDPNIVWIGLGAYRANTLFKTTDGGATMGAWTQIAGLPGAPIYSLVQHPASPSWLYAGTGVGLFASADGGATWSASNDGPANVVVRSLAWNTTGPVSELLVGTFGRGAWKAPIGVARTDMGADGKSDLLYRNISTGQIYRMFMNGLSMTSAALAYTEPNTAWKVIADADFNGDGVSDLLWRNSANGQVYLMPFAGNGMPTSGTIIWTEPNAAWKIVATPDFDGDGKSDILWWNSVTGQVYGMLVNGSTIGAQGLFYTEGNTNWQIVATGDFAGTGKRNQLVWRNATTGQIYLMTVNVNAGTFSQTGVSIYQEANTAWKIIGAPDLNGDGKSDLLWRNDVTGQVYGMLLNNGAITSQAMIHTEPNLAWKIVAQGDYNGDGKSDLLWRNDSTGQVYMMLMNGLTIGTQGLVYTEPNTAWHLLGPYEYSQ